MSLRVAVSHQSCLLGTSGSQLRRGRCCTSSAAQNSFCAGKQHQFLVSLPRRHARRRCLVEANLGFSDAELIPGFSPSSHKQRSQLLRLRVSTDSVLYWLPLSWYSWSVATHTWSSRSLLSSHGWISNNLSHGSCAVNGGNIPEGAGVYAIFNADELCEYVGLSRQVRGVWMLC